MRTQVYAYVMELRRQVLAVGIYLIPILQSTLNHSIKMKNIHLLTLGLLICVGNAFAYESWNFQSYNNDGTKGEAGYFSLMDEKDGKGTLINYVRKLNVCWQGSLPVTVENTADEKIITIPPKMNDCATVRFVLKNDGTGGSYERLGDNGKWIKSAQDRGLQKR